MSAYFTDRRDAGRQLAAKLGRYAHQPSVIVLGLPRGGVPVAAEVARALGAPLDALMVRKLGVPGHEELAMGAIASGGLRVVNDEILRDLRLSPSAVDAVEERERMELVRRERAYRGDRPFPDLAGRTVIVVDDGLATGATMRAALEAVRRRAPAWLVAAAPVGSPSVRDLLRDVADEVVLVAAPEPFHAVGAWYRSFPPTQDDEVRDDLTESWRIHHRQEPGSDYPGV
jgi:putative phosphoribosyl transferase